MAGAKVQMVEKKAESIDRIGGFLGFFLALFVIDGVGSLWIFFYAIAGLAAGADGTMIAVLWEILIGSLLSAGGFLAAAILLGLRQKIAKLAAWSVLGVQWVFTTIASITLMTLQTTSYDYYSGNSSTVGLPASVIVMLVGVIFVTLVENGLIAVYFILSSRVKATLVK